MAHTLTACGRHTCSSSRIALSRTSSSGRHCQRRRNIAVAVQAEAQQQPPVKVPKGVSTPSKNPDTPPSLFGFVDYAERINSRAAMIGFFSLLLLEAILGKGILQALGLGIGSGLGFEV